MCLKSFTCCFVYSRNTTFCWGAHLPIKKKKKKEAEVLLNKRLQKTQLLQNICVQEKKNFVSIFVNDLMSFAS